MIYHSFEGEAVVTIGPEPEQLRRLAKGRLDAARTAGRSVAVREMRNFYLALFQNQVLGTLEAYEWSLLLRARGHHELARSGLGHGDVEGHCCVF